MKKLKNYLPKSEKGKNKINIKYLVIGVVVVAALILIIIRGQEDTWIKNKNGVWVKHGNPKDTPAEVVQQQDFIKRAQQMYAHAKSINVDLSQGPCLGRINNDYVADIAHNPRQKDIDDKPENQCTEFRQGAATHFIELDPDGNIIQIK